ncbi:MAG: hypothetical protein CMM54_02360 [Rhodospirillaceae bacterium]|nr:hypothetical protein [Rhodospirillaceae bacterium]|tara:strand:- start:3663 stop:4784 length:1122 start_codon:yes stop_codon:yes gene_type:complete
MTQNLSFKAIKARQSKKHDVFVFAATAQEVFELAEVKRAGRSEQGDLFGFQRPKISTHIHEIRDYLKRDEAVLPNSVVLAFVNGVTMTDTNDGTAKVTIDISNGPCGLIVDGQQRLSALQPLADRDFQIFVSAIVCKDEEELRRQFILINNTRPLPKELIYELLPSVKGLPYRLSNRSFAAALTARLNFDKKSSLFSVIRQHTNPSGILSSNAIQKTIMNSRSNGAIREFIHMPDGEDRAFSLISDFYGAVQDVFPEAWGGMNPKTSRLVHGAGIQSMGYAMEMAYARHAARDRNSFADKIMCLKEHVAWTSGYWKFPGEDRPWNKLQNTAPDIRLLSDFLVRIVRDQGGDDEENMKLKFIADEIEPQTSHTN